MHTKRRLFHKQLFALILMSGIVRLFAVAYHSEIVNIRNSQLVVKCTSKTALDSLVFYCARCSRLVDDYLEYADRSAYPLNILERIPGEEESSKKSLDNTGPIIWVEENETEVAFAEKFFRALVTRRLVSLSHQKTIRSTPFLSVVIAGFTHRFVRGRHSTSGFYEPDYSIARDQFLRKEYPRLSILLQTDIPVKQEYLYELYMMHCDLVLQFLSRLSPRGKNCTRDLLVLDQQEGNVFEKCEQLCQDKAGKDTTLQAYYERIVSRMANLRVRSHSEDAIETRIRELETVSVLSADGKTAIQRVPLDDLPLALKDYRLDIAGVLRLEKNFLDLSKMAPYYLRSAVEQYARAVATLENGNESSFRNALKDAREAMKAAQAKQQKLDAFISKAEDETTSILQKFLDYVRIYRYYRELDNHLGPCRE